MRAWIVIALAACGGTSAPPATPAGPPAAFEPAPRAGDAVVARVDGRPIYASCVEQQAARGKLDARHALDECIAFELLAGAAQARGLARDPEVILATKTALVSELLAEAFEAGLQKPSDFGDVWAWATSERSSRAPIWQFKHVEYRGSTYVRVPLAPDATPAADAAAHALADKLAAAVADERGLTTPDFIALEQRVAPLTEHCNEHSVAPCWDAVPPYKEGALDASYAAALFALDVGRASKAVRSQWGWDVIVLTELVPAAQPSDAELAADLMPIVKQVYFPQWVDSLARGLGITPWLAPDLDALLERAP